MKTNRLIISLLALAVAAVIQGLSSFNNFIAALTSRSQSDVGPAMRGKVEARVCLESALFFRRGRPGRSRARVWPQESGRRLPPQRANG